MVRPVVNVSSPQRGVRTVSRLTDLAGTAQGSTTLLTVNEDALLDEWQNQGVRKHAIRGDGRVWFSILTAPPAAPAPGDLWLEDTGGELLVRVQGSTGLLSFSSAGVLTLTSAGALLQGNALYVTPAGQVAYAVADAGSPAYRTIGLATTSTLASVESINVSVTGDVVQLPDWTLVTGTATLAPGSRYFLSATPGKLSTSPAATVVVPVGTALDFTRLLLNIERPVFL